MMTEQFKEINDELGQNSSREIHVDSPGAYLSARRQVLGWSIEQVADQIKLAPRQVIAIECDDYPALPPMVITRGFMRAYAKCLKVDVTPLLAMVKLEVVPKIDAPPLRRAIPVNFSEGRFPLMGKKNGILSKWSMGVIFLILVLFSVVLAQKMGWLPDLSTVAVASSINRDVVMPGEISIPPKSDLMARPPQLNKADAAAISVLSPMPISELKVLSDVPVIVTPTALDAAAEENQLVLQAHEDSWVEIKRANNSIAISRILKAGEIEKFEMSEPVLLTIGNVSGVSVTLRGDSFNAKAGVNGNVARINLK